MTYNFSLRHFGYFFNTINNKNIHIKNLRLNKFPDFHTLKIKKDFICMLGFLVWQGNFIFKSVQDAFLNSSFIRFDKCYLTSLFSCCYIIRHIVILLMSQKSNPSIDLSYYFSSITWLNFSKSIKKFPRVKKSTVLRFSGWDCVGFVFIVACVACIEWGGETFVVLLSNLLGEFSWVTVISLGQLSHW